MKKLALDKQAMNRLSAYLYRSGQATPGVPLSGQGVEMGWGTDEDASLPDHAIPSAMSGEIDKLIVRIQAVLNQFQSYASTMGPTGAEIIYILQDVVTNLTDSKQRMMDEITSQMSNTLSPASGSY